MISYACRATALQTLGLWSAQLPRRYAQWPGTSANRLIQFCSIGPQSDKLNLQPLKKDGTRLYSKEEDATLISMRSQGIEFAQNQKTLPHRSIQSLNNRWKHYLRDTVDPKHQYTRAPYSTSDLEKIRHLRASGLTWKQLQAEHFPDRGAQALKNAYSMWLRFPFRATTRGFDYISVYSAGELERLRHLKDELGLSWEEIQKQMPHRTVGSLKWHWCHRGRGSNKTQHPYFPHEDEMLYRMRSEGATFPQIAAHMPGRTVKALRRRYHDYLRDGPRR